MHFSTFFTLAAAVCVPAVLAHPPVIGDRPPPPAHRGPPPPPAAPACITDAQAQYIAEQYGQTFSNYSTALANSLLSEDVVDYSSSVNAMIDGGGNSPVNITGPTSTGRAALEAVAGSQPPFPFKVLNVWHTCDMLTVRWTSVDPAQFTPGAVAHNPIVGIAALELQHNGGSNWTISNIFSEFNSLTWAVDLGIVKPVNATA